MNRAPLLTFSHLRWDFVYQRPQHVMTRLALRRQILFVEEPVACDGDAWLEISEVAPHVQVCRPHLPGGGRGFAADQDAALVVLLRRTLSQLRWEHHAAWLYTPMATHVARALSPRAMIYDCMDELSNFHQTPPELAEREKELLAVCDVVLTGGPSLYRAKCDRHRFVRCFPSSVDLEHFGRTGYVAEPEDQSRLPRPRLGFFGVIDERMDADILEAMATSHPDWQIVMVGPVVKRDTASLPQAENLHYLGQRGYGELPSYLSGWDVCLLPYAIGPATRFISPTKLLEYMAADRPIASTPITDVAEPYGEIVHLGDGPEGFVAACERALGASTQDRQARRARAQQVLRRTSWDETVRRMEEIVHYLADFIPADDRVQRPIRRPAEARA